jgi:hypothetical protein
MQQGTQKVDMTLLANGLLTGTNGNSCDKYEIYLIKQFNNFPRI